MFRTRPSPKATSKFCSYYHTVGSVNGNQMGSVRVRQKLRSVSQKQRGARELSARISINSF